jgi:hypothetical protein
MQQRTLQILYTYWNGLRAGRVAPARLEIDPSRIGAILPEIFLLERMDAATYRYRLAGTRLCEIFGSELRGSNLLDGWSPPDRAALAGDLALTCERGAVIHLILEASADGERRVQLEATFLPLMHAEGAIGRVIGAMSATASPHWLGHDPVRARRLVHHELIWPDGRPNTALAQMPPQSQPQSSASATADGLRRSFRVLDGGRKED